jgi:hypothetical protein
MISHRAPATVLCFAALALLSCRDRNPAQCVLYGAVRDSVTTLPIPRLKVELAGPHTYITLTASNGSYCFETLAPGEYGVMLRRNGYHANPPHFHLNAGHTRHLDWNAEPLAAITGRVLDFEGEPAVGVAVNCIRAERDHGVQQFADPMQFALTNDLGEYRIENLWPGTYYVRAGWPDGFLRLKQAPGQPEMSPVSEWYPGAIKISEAKPLDVPAGHSRTGIDFRLTLMPVFHVRGTVAGGPFRDLLMSHAPGVAATPVGEPSNCGLFRGTLIEDGAFDLVVPSGRYLVQERDFKGDPLTGSVVVAVGPENAEGVSLGAKP